MTNILNQPGVTCRDTENVPEGMIARMLTVAQTAVGAFSNSHNAEPFVLDDEPGISFKGYDIDVVLVERDIENIMGKSTVHCFLVTRDVVTPATYEEPPVVDVAELGLYDNMADAITSGVLECLRLNIENALTAMSEADFDEMVDA